MAKNTNFVRAYAVAESSTVPRVSPHIQVSESGLPKIAELMFSLMLRNIASDGFTFTDPTNLSVQSLPGCVIAAASLPLNSGGVNQDYVYNWTRDAAITMTEVAVAQLPTVSGASVQALIDYVTFAQICQTNATPTLAHACFTINGYSRNWSDQNDGPALQSLAILKAFEQLDAPTQAIAKNVITTNLTFLLNVYENQTTNLWEEHMGFSFFARSAQLLFFRTIKTNTAGIAVPAAVDAAIAWLETALAAHWNGTIYVSVMPQPAEYDPNIDIVCASIYGAIPCTDTKLLATAAKLRSQWEDPSSPAYYPINGADKALGIGPMMGRYLGDVYDGDTNDPTPGDHPWALCTCNFAQLYYALRNEILKTQTVPFDEFSAPFFTQLGVDQSTSVAAVAQALLGAGDAMLQAVIYHSDHLELSEQFDGVSGYEKSVKNLTWSYGAFLSAVRTRNA